MQTTEMHYLRGIMLAREWLEKAIQDGDQVVIRSRQRLLDEALNQYDHFFPGKRAAQEQVSKEAKAYAFSKLAEAMELYEKPKTS